MSTTIDEKVVEMRFDNKNFESNVKDTMSTLDKFKQKLNLTGASKGLENLNTTANKVNMSGMSNALDSVHAKFSALDVIGVTALANIANSAVEAGKRMVKALTIDPVMDGWREYELMLNSMQTIMNGTGKTAEEVEKELKKLDDYADKTVYSTADMVNNISKFTNAGVDLETTTKAMIGIANAVADAGGGASQASSAFYNLGQSIGTGYLTRIDYNSISNTAQMTTMKWKELMIEAAIATGTLTKAEDGLYKAGNKTFSMQQLFIDGLQERWATSDVILKVLEAYGDETTEIGKRAYAAATEVKTFSAMMESLKASAGTGWKDTWQIIFGDLEPAKKFWTGLSEFIGNIIKSISNFRNGILESALNKSFKGVFDGIKATTKVVKEAVQPLKDYTKLVDEIIAGKWKNAPTRWQELEAAGYDWAHAQNLVNERLGCSVRHATNYSEAQTKVAESQELSTEATKELLLELLKLSDAELKAKGYTDEQIAAFRELEKIAKKTGIPIEELVNIIDEFNGRWLLINSFKNIGQGLVATFTAVKDAFKEIFFGTTDSQQIISKLSEGLFYLIAAFHKFTTYLTVNDRAAENLKDTFKGVFAILDMILTIVGGPIKIGFKILGQLFKALDWSAEGVLEFTGGIGRSITAFHDWLESVLDFTAVFEALAPYLKQGASAVRDWANSLLQTEPAKKFIGYLTKVKDSILDWIKGLKEAENIGEYIIEGLRNGLGNGVKGVINFVIDLGKRIIEGIKKVLGIHSPSTVFFEIGKNIVQGLFNGISSIVGMVYNLIISVGGKLIEIVKSLDLGSIFTIALGGGFVFGLVTIAKALTAITEPLESLDYLIFQAGKTVKAFRGFLNTLKLNLAAEALKSIAIGIAILAGSIAVLSMLDQGAVWSAVGAISVLMILLGALTAVAGHFGTGEGLEFGKIALSLLGVAVAMGIMAFALKTISGIDNEKCIQTILGFVAISGAMLLMMKTIGKNGDKMSKLGTTFMSMGAALIMMAFVAKILGGMNPTELAQGLKAIFAFSLIIVGLMFSTQLLSGSKNVDKIGPSIAKIGGAILMMAIVARLLGGMDREALIQGSLAIVAFSAVIAGLMWATKLITGSKNVDKIGGAIAGIGGALLMMAITAKILGGMKVEDLVKGGLAVAAFGVIVTGLMWATKLVSGKDLTKLGSTILMVSISIGLLAVVAALLSLMSVDGLIKGITAVGFLALFMAGLMAAAHLVPQGILGTLITITVAIGILSIAVAGLSMINPERLKDATIAISAVMAMFALIMASSGLAGKSLGVIITLTAAIAVLAGAIYVIAQLPANQAINAALSLSILLATMAGVMTIMGLMSGVSGQALLGVLGMVALCIPLYAIVEVLSKMQGIQNAAQNAAVLAGFLGVLAVVQLLCAAAGAIYLATMGVAATGLLGMVALIGTLYMIIDVLTAMENLPNAITNLTALQSFLITMTEILVVLAIVGPLALIGVAAMAGLTALMGAIGLFAVGVGALMEKFPNLESFLNTGLPVLVQLASGIGQMIGAFVSGVLTQLSAGLPVIGMNLSMFMMNLTPFITGIKLVDGTVLKGVGILAGAILALTAVDLINGVVSFLSGGSSFADLGTELSTFMMNAMPFILLSKQIDPSIMTGIKTLAEAVMIITGANVVEGLTSWFTGGNSLETFGTQLTYLGEGLNNFITAVGPITGEQVSTAQNAAEIIKTLAGAAKEIPNTGGLLADLIGENNMSEWAMQLPFVAAGISGFIKTITEAGIQGDAVNVANTAADVIKTLAGAAKEIPNTGGLLKDLIGDNDLSTFAGQLPNVGKGIVGFIEAMSEGGITEDKAKIANTAAEIVKTLAGAAQEIPNAGGWLAALVGDNELGKFAEEFPDVGKGIAGFAKELGEFGEAKLSTVNAAVSAIYSIAALGNIDMKTTGDGLKGFGSKMVDFAKKIKEFVNKVSEVGADSITSAISKTQDLIDMANTIATSNIESLKTFGESLKTFAKEGVKGFVEEFSGTTPKEDAKEAVSAMVEAGIEGAEGKKESVTEKFGEIGDAAVDALCTDQMKEDASQAGVDLVTGFANGITNNTYLATNAGSALGKAALKAAKEAIDAHSPSREANKLGNFFGVGFVNGIKDWAEAAYDESYNVAEFAKAGLSQAISKVSALINSGIDSQPTIRPILDLSDVESGVGSLNGMFNNGPSLAIATNLGAISSGMNGRIQNGGSDDVVSAINKLGKNLGNTKGGDTYNINGITYDDGSNITDAVKTLVRAAKMGRRV